MMVLGTFKRSLEAWELSVAEKNHNHEASHTISAHPFLQKLNTTQSQDLEVMTNAGQPPRVIRSVIQQSDPQLSLRLSDIYNARAKYRLAKLAGRTPIQALLEDLISSDTFHRHKTDDNGHLTHLFIALPTSISLFRQHHDILLLDCTYRTNRYKMPLLNIAGATGMNTTLQLALVFLCAETKEDNTWALTSLQDMLSPDGNSPSVIVTDRERALISACQAVFPEVHHILCRWHVGKNVPKSCKKHFTTEEDWEAFYAQWNAVVNSITEEEYEVQLREFTMGEPILPVTYCLDNWLLEWKTKVVKAWVDHILHFGHTVTSRIEVHSQN